MLDMILADHLSKLYKEIRNQALIQVLCACVHARVCEQCMCVHVCVSWVIAHAHTYTYIPMYVCV